MIRINQKSTREIRVCWDTGSEFQYLMLLKKLIEHRNDLEKRRSKE